MKKALSSALAAYRQFRSAKNKSRTYKIARYVLVSSAVAYVLLLSFPQVLFAHEISYKNFEVYSQGPLDKNIYAVLDQVESKLAASTINNTEVKPKIFLTDSYRFYSLLSLSLGGNSFGKGFPLLPTTNVFINKSDVEKDLVFRDSAANNQRSLNGVIAHEITHLMIRKRIGYFRNFMMPEWKREGYCEYVAGGSTLPYESGVRMWKANPKNGTGYQYFKYYMSVKHLLENEKLGVDELFDRNIDVEALEAKVLNTF